MANQFVAGQDNYPKTVDDAMTRISNCEGDKAEVKSRQPNKHAKSFVQTKDRRCYGCGELGHIAKSCPKAKSEDKVKESEKSSKGAKEKKQLHWASFQRAAARGLAATRALEFLSKYEL